MSPTKIVLILLVVMAVLFGGILFASPSDSSTTVTADSFSAATYPMLGSLNNLLAPFAPKVSAQSLVPLTQIFDLAQTPEYTLTVLPDASQKFRQLAFTATPSKSCAQVTYTPSNAGALNQETSDKAGSSDHPDRFAFILSGDGGTLDVKRANNKDTSLCVLTLQVKS